MTKAEAIAACRRMQDSHIAWFDWLGVREEPAATLELIGDRESHRLIVEEYEGIIAVLETAP